MPLGKASIKRATCAIEKQGAKKEKAAFSAECVLTEVALEELRIPAGKACAASDALVKELQNHVKKTTAPYKYPRVIEFVEELPKTISGKIRRVEIRENDSEGSETN